MWGDKGAAFRLQYFRGIPIVPYSNERCVIAHLIGRPRRSVMSYGGGDSMIDALVGIAATIYIFKFVMISSNRIQQSGVVSKSTAAAATGQSRRASVAMKPKSDGSGRAVRNFA